MKSKIINYYENSKYQKNLYADWFSELIEGQYYKYDGDLYYTNVDEFKNECCFFSTVTFRIGELIDQKRRLYLPKTDTTLEFDNFHLLYNMICRKMFGPDFMEQRFQEKRPFAIVSVDYENSRHSSDSNQPKTNPHIHAVWCLHPDEVALFEKTIGSLWFKDKTTRLLADKIEFQKFQTDKESRSGTATYVAKSFIKEASDPSAVEILRIYPDNNYNPSLRYRAENTQERRNYPLEKMRRAAAKENASSAW